MCYPKYDFVIMFLKHHVVLLLKIKMHRDEIAYVKDHSRGSCITIKYNDKKNQMNLLSILSFFDMRTIHSYS
jgi:hypothetical protein